MHFALFSCLHSLCVSLAAVHTRSLRPVTSWLAQCSLYFFPSLFLTLALSCRFIYIHKSAQLEAHTYAMYAASMRFARRSVVRVKWRLVDVPNRSSVNKTNKTSHRRRNARLDYNSFKFWVIANEINQIVSVLYRYSKWNHWIDRQKQPASDWGLIDKDCSLWSRQRVECEVFSFQTDIHSAPTTIPKKMLMNETNMAWIQRVHTTHINRSRVHFVSRWFHVIWPVERILRFAK